MNKIVMIRYINQWHPDYNTIAFKAACRLVIEGCHQPSGYTEPILHEMSIQKKKNLA